MEYNFSQIERDAKDLWKTKNVYKVENPAPGTTPKPKYYILDMFPYPSGAGLHVGHPLGYIASDIYARYKKLCGYNVLHPMGFDAFGLPAEQYAMETGQHPAVTTEKNIARYREQLDNIGFCYDWDRQVRTSEPNYYKWTQWIFLQLFHSWYDRSADKARPMADLIAIFELEGNKNIPCPGDDTTSFTHTEWGAYSEKEKRAILMNYRVAYQGYAQVWWCEALGTVLANDEVVNGVSERGGHPVERKNMRQWFLRITEFADRLLKSLDTLEWTEAMKEMQRNWIGKSNGAEVKFDLGEGLSLMVFTTRPDTIFGVDFMVMAPEHELVDTITTVEQKDAIDEYKKYVKSRSERERMSEVKQVTGCFTGAHVTHPLTGKKLPVWISEYVLAGYGTGAIMAVPSGDDRDHAFATHFKIPITNVFGDSYTGDTAYSSKTGTIENSDFLSGMKVADAIDAAIDALVKAGVGKKKVNFRLRDAGFSRQRYWGEPFPIVYIDDVPYGTDESEVNRENNLGTLPVELPMVEHYKPGPEGQGPLANIPEWMNISLSTGEGRGEAFRETNTMPGYAGSSWYFLRYMDPHNEHEFADRAATDYWQQVDLYIGGTEHAVGHLLYSRMWTKALYDLGHIGFDEPFKKLLNQGMIQGKSYFLKVVQFPSPSEGTLSQSERTFVISQDKEWEDLGLRDKGTNFAQTNLRFRYGHDYVDPNGKLTEKSFEKYKATHGLPFEYEIKWNEENGQKFILVTEEVEKMSKSKYNVVNPDDIVAQYGADTFRMYEMFLGPIDMSKPWDTKGIEGVHRFLKKLWRLYADEQKGWIVTDEAATDAELRILHKTIKKISEDMERFSFNTSVSQFMITVNELGALNCHKRGILEPLAVLICPFAPHIAEELWHKLGNDSSVVAAQFPQYENKYVVDNSKNYPVAINGKARLELEFALDAADADVQAAVLANEAVQKWMEGKPLKKFIYVKGKMINVVV
ncbi:leucine--tRNA ligase [Flavipsychrobacter stenotrophus]|uniref:Leucine--tRNA ligase n=1 Tax=Flavipsychrobacter stenotrophus TaxID=2077091 RepID=A0A2S7SXL6_9BACT|nr:class I tRNA ligase family protein [Flavipsychrobacter stenotrophus]PQJ11663.1 leucine--tRNA ligase [Flavipsychrobacter stenotrophus]